MNNTLVGKKIMWVEDDKFLSDIIAKRFTSPSTQCTFIHAATGQEMFEQLKNVKPDIIVLDIMLPGMDGFEILTKLKQDTSLQVIPVMLLSNLNQKADIERGLDLGAVKFLVKALLTPDDIVEEVSRVLAK